MINATIVLHSGSSQQLPYSCVFHWCPVVTLYNKIETATQKNWVAVCGLSVNREFIYSLAISSRTKSAKVRRYWVLKSKRIPAAA